MKIQIGDSLFNSCNERIVKTNSHLVTGEKKKNVQNIIDVKEFYNFEEAFNYRIVGFTFYMQCEIENLWQHIKLEKSFN